MEEEGDTITPISGDIDSNFAGLEAERKKKLRNQIIIWGAASLGIIIAVTIIIILILNSGGEKGEQGKDGEKDDKKDDEDDGPIPEEVFGNITCIYEVNQGEINILSDEFEKNFDLAIYVGRERKKYSKTYNFNLEDSKTVRFEIHSKEISLKNMFKRVNNLKGVYFTTSKEGTKITSMESTFEECLYLDYFYIDKGWDTTGLTTMTKAFAHSISLEEIDFDNMALSNVKDMSHMLEGTRIYKFEPKIFDISSVENMAYMFQNCYNLNNVKFVEGKPSNNLNTMENMFAGCESLTEVNLNGLSTSNVRNMKALFQGCTNLVNVVFENFDTTQVTDMSFMFERNKALIDLTLNFDTRNVKTMNSMFRECSSINYKLYRHIKF